MDNVDASTQVSVMLERLDKVRKNNKRGWVARCPCHEDKSASLSICEGDNGRVLINCFAGCAAIDVVHALGMTLADLFPRRINDKMSPEEKAELHEISMRSKWSAALGVLDRESLVVYMVAEKIRKGGNLDERTVHRVAVAANRISEARVILRTGPAKSRHNRGEQR